MSRLVITIADPDGDGESNFFQVSKVYRPGVTKVCHIFKVEKENNSMVVRAGDSITEPAPAPEIALAALFKDELGVEMHPQALRLFIRWHWDKVRKLAHQIHGTPLENPDRYLTPCNTCHRLVKSGS